MRRKTRLVAGAIVATVLALLALGALPGHLGSGAPYHLRVTPADAAGPAVNASDVSERRYPYLTGALAAEDGLSAGYRRGPLGLKESFSHSPFDEVGALAARDPDARAGEDAVRIVHDGRRYRVAVVRA